MNPFYAITATILYSVLAYPRHKLASPNSFSNLASHGNFRKNRINPMNNLGSYDPFNDQQNANHLNHKPRGLKPDLDDLEPYNSSNDQQDFNLNQKPRGIRPDLDDDLEPSIVAKLDKQKSDMGYRPSIYNTVSPENESGPNLYQCSKGKRIRITPGRGCTKVISQYSLSL
ncbi:hypothetical protein DSO57_1028330 [Entomophthora muscae]|uniref:Uncharacterized protein n=1 Tax=Entomophthora muscae TaxID=34485 RepID=A0ACC2SR39_9FUNG|nr:hypothetical protein DSO57_1028330 [Entomophthora muscae]